MNYHISPVFHRKKYYILAWIAFSLLVFSEISNSSAQEAQSITLSTDKGSYLPGDTVMLSGVISGQPSSGVALEVKDSDGNLILIRTVQPDQNGNFAVQFKIPPTATSGNFSVTASARVNGFLVTQTKVFAATVPEFSFTAPIMLVSFASILLLYKIRLRK